MVTLFEIIKRNRIFIFSLIIGPIIWLCAYLVLPIERSYSLNFQTIFFISLSYLSLIFGYFSFSFKEIKVEHNIVKVKKYFWIVGMGILLAYILHYIELFFIRDLSFTNEIFKNKNLKVLNNEKGHFIFGIATIIKALYFFPYVVLIGSNNKNSYMQIFAMFFLLLPVPEAILLGTRKPLFDIFLIVFLSNLIFGKSKLTTRKALTYLLMGVSVFGISNYLLFKRQKERVLPIGLIVNESLINATYNNFVSLNKDTRTFLLDSSISKNKKKIVLSTLQAGQYIVHGVFEFQYNLEQETLPMTYGKFTFSAIPKILKKLGFEITSVENINPRGPVYITTFGGFYMDFRWTSIFVFFLVGILQRYTFEKSLIQFDWKPIVIYFFFFNVFLCVYNFLRGAGIFPLLAFLFYLLMKTIILKSKNEKSINS